MAGYTVDLDYLIINADSIGKWKKAMAAISVGRWELVDETSKVFVKHIASMSLT